MSASTRCRAPAASRWRSWPGRHRPADPPMDGPLTLRRGRQPRRGPDLRLTGTTGQRFALFHRYLSTRERLETFEGAEDRVGDPSHGPAGDPFVLGQDAAVLEPPDEVERPLGGRVEAMGDEVRREDG